MVEIEKLKDEAKLFNGWEDEMCKKCKGKVIEKMKPVAAGINAGGYKKKWAEAKMAAMSLTLWRDLCPLCVKRLKKKVGKK